MAFISKEIQPFRTAFYMINLEEETSKSELNHRLPTDIKRKPEKKKKVGEQSLQILPRSS
jgi:hypothetical protein